MAVADIDTLAPGQGYSHGDVSTFLKGVLENVGEEEGPKRLGVHE